MDRKKFIKECGFACLGALAFPTFLESCGSSSHFAQGTVSNNEFIIKKAEFTHIKNNKSTERKYVLVKPDQFTFPVCIYKTGENMYTALLMECTHKGCELQPHGDYLVCPCHGSEFSNSGVVQNPPAEENLKTFKTRTDNDNIYITL